MIHMMANPQEALAAISQERENLAWISRSIAILRKKFGDRYIAVRNCRVIDHDENVEALLARVRKLEHPESVTIEFVSALELAWML